MTPRSLRYDYKESPLPRFTSQGSCDSQLPAIFECENIHELGDKVYFFSFKLHENMTLTEKNRTIRLIVRFIRLYRKYKQHGI